MTIGELKEKLKNIPDDLEVVAYQSDMERYGIMSAYISPEIKKYNATTRNGYDSFDGCSYTYEVFEENENGSVKAVELNIF